MQRQFRQVDVFNDGEGLGNPVAVVLDAEGLSASEMRRFSVWSNLSECTFVLPPTSSEADYRVRIFSLNAELPFAGHPTLGTARAWLDAGGVPAHPARVMQECQAGLIPIRIEDDVLAFKSPPSTRTGPVDPETLDSVLDILGVAAANVVDAAWVDNGPGWVGVLLDHADTVLSLRPDASRFPGHWNVGVVGAHAHDSEFAFEVRAFFTDGSDPLREDPVTGSLNGALGEWLVATGRANTTYVARQGTAIGRNGRVHIDHKAGEVWVGGRADVIISGSVRI
jgi:PhzF family phenazine biosynthesis protein